MQIPVHNINGDVVEQIDIRDDVFAVPFNEVLVHQAMVRQLANARQGTQSTKTRSEVAGSTRKLYAQKHTGHARAGDIKSPLRRGGGIAGGPKPRSYHQDLPKKMRRQALKSALSAKASEGELVVLDQFQFEKPATKDMAQILTKLGIENTALVVTPEPEESVVLSARNLPGIKTMPAHILNVVDLLSYRKLLMTVSAIRKVESIWGEESSQGRNGGTLPGDTPAASN